MAQDSETLKPKANNSSESNRSKTADLIRHFMGQLAMAMGQVIPAERSILYIRALSDLTEKQLAYGFEQALKRFKPEFGKVFPSPAEIREWADELIEIPIGRKFASVNDIDPEKCPKGWSLEDVFRAHLTQEKIRGDYRRHRFDDERPMDFSDLDAAGRKSGFSPQETARWLEESKSKQRAHIATLEANPEWHKMAQRLGGKPGFAVVPSTVPADPVERKRWAHDKARQNGWIREPGEDDE